ncbi:MAG: hypothetical protein ABIT16_09345 [Croceibacterium sp.]
MKRTVSLLALGGMVLAPLPAQAEDGVFTPSGNWIADYGDDYCRLVRTFTDGKDEVSLGLERIQPGAQVRLILIGNSLRPFRGADQLGYQFLPAGGALKTRYVRSRTGDDKQYLALDAVTLAPFVFTPPAPGTPPAPPPVYSRDKEQETAQAITAVSLSEGLIAPVRFETGSLKAPMAALQACADDLLQVWGLDPEKHKTLTANAFPNLTPDGWLPQGTIPFTEFSKFAGGANQVRMLIGVDGKPSSCTIYSPSLAQSLNARICSILMEKASFAPAKDAAGQAMASYWMGSPIMLGPRPGGRR